jgi:hypothetical protein
MRSELGAVRRQEQVRASGASRRGRALRVAGGATALAAAGVGAFVVALYSQSPEPRRSDAPAGAEELARTRIGADENDAGAGALHIASPEPRRSAGEKPAAKLQARPPQLLVAPAGPLPASVHPIDAAGLYSASPEGALHGASPEPRRSDAPAAVALAECAPRARPLQLPAAPVSRALRSEAPAEAEELAKTVVEARRAAGAAEHEHESKAVEAETGRAGAKPQLHFPQHREVCCKQHTQFPERMRDCGESGLHEVAAVADWAFRAAGWPAYEENLDGIVKLTYPGPAPVFGSEHLMMISPGPDGAYVSDHDGASVDLFGDDDTDRFNLVTQNLEGLCRADSVRRRIATAALRAWFGPHVRRGTIMVIQELALQLQESSAEAVTPEQSTELEANGATLRAALDESLNLVVKTDGYTGCLVYDSAVWTLDRTLEIARKGTLKRSDAHLMRHKFVEYATWVVNVHLKAPSRGSWQATIDAIHVEELQNILQHVLEANVDGLPVYLCGDFNNASAKGDLVAKALETIRKDSRPDHLAA